MTKQKVLRKSEIISNIKAKSGYSSKTIEEIINAYLKEVEEGVIRGEKVCITGIGKIFKYLHKKGNFFNFKKDGKVNDKEYLSIKFKKSSCLAKKINQ